MAAQDTVKLLRTLAQNIVKECRKLGEQVPESLAIFMLRLAALEPERQNLLSGHAAEDVIKDVISICVSKLKSKSNPSILTLKIQVFFDLNYRDREEFLKTHRQLQHGKLAPFLRTIVTKPCNTTEDMERIYDEIINFVIMKSGMGDPGDTGVYSEAKNAVATLFSISGMPQFASKSRSEKSKFIEQLTPVACGLRLYAWYEGKGGYGIQNVCETLHEAAPKFNLRLEFELENVKNLIQKLERILTYYVLEEFKQDVSQSDPYRDARLLDYWKSMLICMNQLSIFLHMIKKEAEALSIHASQMESQFRMCLKQLKSLIKSSSIFPVGQVFPLYKYLSDLWNCMQEDILLLSSYTSVVQTLKRLSEQAGALADKTEISGMLNIALERTPPSSNYFSSPGDSNIITNKQLDNSKVSANKDACTQSESGLTATSVESTDLSSGTVAISNTDSMGLVSRQSLHVDLTENLKELVTDLQIALGDDHKISIIFSDSVKNFKDISLHLQGFCPWALVSGNGVLLPAVKDFGIIAFDDCYYGFCCKFGAMMFLKNPIMYVDTIWKIARENAELIFLLQIQDHFGIPTSCRNMCPNIIHPIFIAESGTQTVLHPVKTYIEPTYRWNQWDLRRLALKYVDMQSKQTHSTQTDLSHFRRENFSQVWPPKNNSSQTKRDGSTTMPKHGIPELVRKVRNTIL